MDSPTATWRTCSRRSTRCPSPGACTVESIPSPRIRGKNARCVRSLFLFHDTADGGIRMARGLRGEASEIGIGNGGTGQMIDGEMIEREHKVLAGKDLRVWRERQASCTR